MLLLKLSKKLMYQIDAFTRLNGQTIFPQRRCAQKHMLRYTYVSR